MIQKVDLFKAFRPNFKQNKNNEASTATANKGLVFTDSFVKHAAQSTPVMLAITTAWSLIDKNTYKIPFKKAMKNNLLNFFTPVLLLSSLLLAGIENRKAKKEKLV